MSRRSLFTGLIVALLATATPAGEIKIHEWPCAFISQEVAAIPVLLDIGFWLEIVNQDAVIKLKQIGIHTYEGCVGLIVRSNFNLRLSCTITPTGVVGGDYSCSVQNANIDAPGGVAIVCARLTNANLVGRPGGSKNVRVATVNVRVVPRV